MAGSINVTVTGQGTRDYERLINLPRMRIGDGEPFVIKGLVEIPGGGGTGGVFAAEIDGRGHLILSYPDGQTPPNLSINEAGHLLLTLDRS